MSFLVLDASVVRSFLSFLLLLVRTDCGLHMVFTCTGCGACVVCVERRSSSSESPDSLSAEAFSSSVCVILEGARPGFLIGISIVEFRACGSGAAIVDLFDESCASTNFLLFGIFSSLLTAVWFILDVREVVVVVVIMVVGLVVEVVVVLVRVAARIRVVRLSESLSFFLSLSLWVNGELYWVPPLCV